MYESILRLAALGNRRASGHLTGSALLLAAVLRIGFAVSWIAAGLAALAYAIEPLALLHERMMMTGNLATVPHGRVRFVFAGIAYQRHPRIAPLPWLLASRAALNEGMELETFFRGAVG